MTRWPIAVLPAIVLGTAGVVFADNLRDLRAQLSGYDEVPTFSTSGIARFEARISGDDAASSGSSRTRTWRAR